MESNRSESMGAKPHVTCPNPTATTASPETFWTFCFTCNVQYEYPRMYLDVLIQCSTCRMMFTATECPPPPIDALWPENSQHLNSQPDTLGGSSESEKLDRGLAGEETLMRQGARGRKAPTRAGARGRRAHSSGNAGTGAASALPGAAGTAEGSKRRSRKSGGATSQGPPQMGCPPGTNKANSELSQSEVREMLMAKARNDISKKLAELMIGAGSSKSWIHQRFQQRRE